MSTLLDQMKESKKPATVGDVATVGDMLVESVSAKLRQRDERILALELRLEALERMMGDEQCSMVKR